MRTTKLMSGRGVLFGALAAMMLAGGAQHAAAQDKSKAAQKSEHGFSFAAYGDSRPMMYLPPKEGQPDVSKLFVEMFGLVMPEKVAEEVVKKDVKLIFDPVTKELIKVVMPFETQDRSHDLDGRQGLGHRGVRRGRETAARRAPDDVPVERRRLGGTRDREGRPVRARQIRGQQRRRRLVGKSGPHGQRQPVLEARE